MNHYKTEFTIDDLNSDRLAAQGLLQAYTGKVVPKSEAVRRNLASSFLSARSEALF